MVFQSLYQLSKYSSDKDICEKCRARNESQSSEEKSSNVKKANKGEKVAVSSKTLVGFVCPLVALVLLLLATIHFLRPLGIFGKGNVNHPQVFASPESGFSNSYHPKHAQAKDDDSQKFLINPKNICSVDGTTDGIKLLILVSSFVSNFDHRQAIRDTWGSLTTKSHSYRLGFVVGSTMNVTASQLLQEESEKYHDVIQCNSEDTHQNLTLKSIAMFKWVAEFCLHAKFFLKADDDIYVNFAILSGILNNEAYLSNPKFITGFLQSGGYFENETNQKGSLSEDDYSDDFHPPYISGSAYLTTGSLSKDLHEVSNGIKPLVSKEDVFITGVCASKTGASLIHDDLFRPDKPYPTWFTYRGIATGNGLEPDEMYKIWKEMIDSFSAFAKISQERKNILNPF